MSDWKNVQYKDGKLRTNNGGSGGSSTFAGLDDVNFSNLADGQIPKYDSQTQKWVNANESGGTVTDVEVDGQSVVNAQGVAEITMPSVPSDLDDLSDVDLTGLSDGDILAYQQSSGKFKPASAPSGGGNVDDVEVNGTSVVDQNKVAKIISYKEVTQSQYNALPASKESDGILYCIKDAPGGVDGFPPLIYSEEEREIGVWRDGKPLYQKTLVYTPSALNQDIDMSALSIDTVVEFSGSFVRAMGSSYGNYDYPIMGRTEGSANNQYGLSYRYQETLKVLNIIIGGYSLAEIISVRMTIRYTKTTDTAGLGQWSTQGNYISSEIVSRNESYTDNQQVTLTLTRKYANPYPYAVNALPLSSWSNGARIVVQTNTIFYDKTNNQLSFKVYVSSSQTYKVDWMVTELGG